MPAVAGPTKDNGTRRQRYGAGLHCHAGIVDDFQKALPEILERNAIGRPSIMSSRRQVRLDGKHDSASGLPVPCQSVQDSGGYQEHGVVEPHFG